MLRSVIGSILRAPAASALSGIGARSLCVHRSLVSCAFLRQNAATLPKTTSKVLPATCSNILQTPLLNAVQQQHQTVRSVTKFSLNKGKRKSVKAVIKRFKRLDWGIWLRTHTGRHKKMWKKSNSLKRRLQEHVFTNGAQSRLLDSMVTNFWRRPKYYINDPYEPYHRRDEFYLTKSKSFKV